MFMEAPYVSLIITTRWSDFLFHGVKLSEEYGKYQTEPIMLLLVNFINMCNPIVNILENRCIKFLWNLLNSDNVLFSRICKYSIYKRMFNSITIIKLFYNIFFLFITTPSQDMFIVYSFIYVCIFELYHPAWLSMYFYNYRQHQPHAFVNKHYRL